MVLKRYRNKAEIGERKKTILCKNTQQPCFHTCVLSHLSLLEMKFKRNFIHACICFGGFLNQTELASRYTCSPCYSPPKMISHWRWMRLLLATILHTNFIHIHTASYTVPATPKQNLHVCWDDCYLHVLPSKNRWYHLHVLVLTSKYTITLHHPWVIRNSVHCWTESYSNRPIELILTQN